MNKQEFLQAYNQSRNGCDHFIRHPLGRKLIYSDGVEECFKAGTAWPAAGTRRRTIQGYSPIVAAARALIVHLRLLNVRFRFAG